MSLYNRIVECCPGKKMPMRKPLKNKKAYDLGVYPESKDSGNNLSEAKAKLGSGARFKSLEKKLSKKHATDPGALAAWIGRKKFGKKRFGQLSAHGKHHSESLDLAAEMKTLSESLIALKKTIVK